MEGGSKISDSTYKNAISGEFINLEEFVSSISREGEANEGKYKVLDNFYVWLRAWNEFEKLIMIVQPQLYSKLSAYRRFIQSIDKKYNWPAIHSYDIRFRTELARVKSFDYDHQNNDLVVTILDATAVKGDLSRCFRCKSVEHVVQACPFPAHMVPVEAIPKENKIKPFRWYHQGTEGCNNFNAGNCNYAQCNRAHVCKGCRSATPYVRCSQCNKR